MARVVLSQVTKTFGKVTAVDHINLNVEDGEFVALVGPSGCGKSTTLRMIAGLEDISSGDMLIGDRQINNIEPKNRNIAMVFQNYALYPHMTVWKNIAFGLRAQKLPKDQVAQKVADAAHILGLEHLLERRPAELSGGQRQRVAMGRAIVRNPEVFLFDEPLSNLDAQLRAQMRIEIKKLHQQVGTTSIYVTHDQIEAMTLADRIVIMKDGRIQQVGTPSEVYQNPTNLFVARFIGSPTMNTIPAHISSGEQGLYITLKDGYSLPLRNPPKSATVGQPVIVGLRPDDILARKDLSPNAGLNILPAHVDLVEPLGSESLIYARMSGAEVIAKAPGRWVPERGSNIHLSCILDHLHLFDAESEQNLC